MENDVIIRKAVRADVPAILELYEELLHEHTDLSNALNDFDSLEVSADTIYVAESECKVIGTIQLSVCKGIAFNCRPFITAEYLIVEKQYRNRGIGTKLLAKIDEIANSVNAECSFFVSSAHRTDAHSFYKKRGYADDVIGFRKTYNEE
ncbi:N-acetyltransferase [Clostridia bacterium]|nr:N-acetyltransferase [Clostridia bacterium]